MSKALHGFESMTAQQRRRYSFFYSAFKIRIARIERDYGFSNE